MNFTLNLHMRHQAFILSAQFYTGTKNEGLRSKLALYKPRSLSAIHHACFAFKLLLECAHNLFDDRKAM